MWRDLKEKNSSKISSLSYSKTDKCLDHALKVTSKWSLKQQILEQVNEMHEKIQILKAKFEELSAMVMQIKEIMRRRCNFLCSFFFG